jgi:hypothetical protein
LIRGIITSERMNIVIILQKIQIPRPLSFVISAT